MSNHDDGHALNDAENALEVVGRAASAIGSAVAAITADDGAGAAQAGLAAASGAMESALDTQGVDGDAREGVEVASTLTSAAASAVSFVAAIARAADSSNVGGATSGLTSAASDASRYVVPEDRANDVIAGVRSGQQIVEGARELASELGLAPGENVEFDVEVEELESAQVVRVSFDESLNDLSSCALTLHTGNAAPTARELLHKSVRVSLRRGEEERSYRGIVRHARVRERHDEHEIELQVVPAYWYLSRSIDSRVYTDKKIPDLVAEIVREFLGGMQRAVEDKTERTYETHELLIQYQESHWNFIARPCEQEGTYYYVDHGGDHEKLVLCDADSSLPSARPSEDGRIPYAAEGDGGFAGHERITAVDHDEEVGATDAVVADYDFTHPSTDIRGERVDRGDTELKLEIYDHTDAVSFHRYSEPAYGENSANLQAQMRAERLDLARQRWSMTSTVITAQPGHVFELTNCPVPDMDGRYMIVSVSGHGATNSQGSGEYRNTFQCVPTSMPYRPARWTRKPVVHGVESATVVVESEDIDTEKHGRVKVRFHWDRVHPRGDSHAICWVRVAHHWAGPGYGFFFLPRKDMEVLVSFLGGNPDRPVVTGCVYNGDNAIRADLPNEKTQSYIRTRSSVEGSGYNEIRFEDKQGDEFISVHAEKDYKEVVEHDHSTHVKNHQTNTVDGNQTETVGGNQTMRVKKNRTKTIDGDEENTIQNKRTLVVHDGLDKEEFHSAREVDVWDHDNLKVHGGNRNTTIEGQYNISTLDHFKVLQNDANELLIHECLYATVDNAVQLKANHGAVHYHAHPSGLLTITTEDKFQVKAKSDFAADTDASIRMKAAQTVVIEAKSELTLKVGSSTLVIKPKSIELTSADIKIAGSSSTTQLDANGVATSAPKIQSAARGVHEITGSVVKINS